MQMLNDVIEYLNREVEGAEATLDQREVGDSVVFVNPAKLLLICHGLKNSPFDFNVLQVITGTDYPELVEVSYILASFTQNHELILKVKLPKENSEVVPSVSSVCEVWTAANFQERECYDLVGVNFEGHPDLRRILCPYDWEGHPLRKDYETPERYNGMIINPEEKMNRDDREFAAKQKAKEAAEKAALKAKQAQEAEANKE